MGTRLHSHARWISVFLVVIVGLPLQSLAAQQSQEEQRFAKVQNVTASDIQQMFYKVEIDKKIDLNIVNSTVEKALKQVARKTGLKLTYRGDIMNNDRITIKKKGIGVSNALDLILKDTHLDYMFSQNGYLLISNKKGQFDQPVVVETVSGLVTDAQTGDPMPGANVSVKGTTTGASANSDGSYELAVPTLQDTLVFSFIGYETQEVPINGRTQIDVQLVPQAVAGEELVVTALGIARETRSIGYSTSTVEPDQFSVNRSGNFMNSLQGQVAGVNIESVASGAGSSSRVRIRGLSSFGSNNSPLIVVDGVPISNQGHHAAIGADGEIDGGDGLNSISPDAIESMTVLKGGAAAALYGSRAKDGVIIITTKRDAGDRGIGVTFNSNVQVAAPYDDRNIQTEYGQGEGGQRPTSSFPGSGVWSFGEKIEPGMTQILFDGIEVPYEVQPSHVENFMRNAVTVNNSLNLSTGGPSSGLNLSVSQLSQESIVPNSNFNRNNISFGFTQDIMDNLNATGNINYSYEKNNMPVTMNNQVLNVPTVIYTLANTLPLDLLRENTYDENGNEIFYSRFAHRTNPFISTDPDKRINNSRRDRLYGNVALRYDPADWLYLQARIGQDYFNRDTEVNTPTGLAFAGPAPEGFYNGSYDENLYSFREINFDFLLGIEQQLNEQLALSGTFGGNIMNQRTDSNTQSADDFIVRDLYTLGNARQIAASYNYTERQVNSLFGEVEFDYKNYLYLNFTARNDWFSTLDPDQRSILYPSVSSSFVFTDVINDLPDWLTQGTLRAAYSEVGSDSDVGFAAGQLTYATATNPYPSRDGGMRSIGSIDGATLPVSGLKPMRVKEYEAGLDLQLLDRINIDLTYYNKRSFDQILNQSISTSTGFSQRPVNVGESENSGVELLVDVTPVQARDFVWNFSVNGSYNKSKVIDLGEETDVLPVGDGDWQTPGGTIRHVEGNPMAEIWVTGYLRDDQGRKIINQNNGLPMHTPEPINFGTAIPKWVGGINNSFQYRNLGFSFLIDFKLGHKLLSGLGHNLYRHGLDPRTLPGRETGRIVVDGVAPDGSENTVEANVYSLYGSYGSLREHLIYNAGYWKLRQVTLDYNLTSLVSDFLPVENMVLSLVGRHLLVFKKWTEQHDPEQVSFTGDNNIGISGAALPMTRNFGFNLKIEL
ncbi:SusC/RagA family TonB-linked outer membrane protein [Halalkalibaculum sp. DA3122]|uniref:SusC/RagA family TonB-linked outer membrane protein n=1 Tax=unclassified Halalkalibaculum TaxID=2964617 RepID=UPI0037549EC6